MEDLRQKSPETKPAPESAGLVTAAPAAVGSESPEQESAGPSSEPVIGGRPEPAKPTRLARSGNARGSRILALTGISLLLLSVGGAVARNLVPLALWSEVFFAVSLAGLVGFSTNWIAIKMLFHPRVRILGIQGVVPSRRKELARSVGDMIEEHLISGDRMHRLLLDTGAVERSLEGLMSRLPSLLEDEPARIAAHGAVTEVMRAHVARIIDLSKENVRKRLHSKLEALLMGTTIAGGAAAKVNPLLGAAGVLMGAVGAGLAKSGVLDGLVDRMIDEMSQDLRTGSALEKAAWDIVDELPRRTEELLAETPVRERLLATMSGAAEDLLKQIDVARLVEAELLAQDEAELEDLINSVAESELVFVQVAGGGLGMVAGFALVWPWLVAPYFVLFLVVRQVARVAERRHAASRGIHS